jgi:iron(III) transport system substrate-binding protein
MCDAASQPVPRLPVGKPGECRGPPRLSPARRLTVQGHATRRLARDTAIDYAARQSLIGHAREASLSQNFRLPVRNSRPRVWTALFGLALFALIAAAPAHAQQPSWVVPDLMAGAKAEGDLIVYGSMNEEEAFPFWKLFSDTSGVKVSYVRSSDANILARIAIENRARQRSWDLVATTPVYRLPDEVLLQFEPAEAKNLIPAARGPNKRWYGVYANYNTPSYNTNLVKAADLPKTYEGFLDHPEWAGHIAIDTTDSEWLSAILEHYGAEKGRKLVSDLVTVLKPVVVDGHLVVARSVGSGEYWVALNNYTSLTLNVKLAGAPTDYWALDPVGLAFGSIGINTLAPHPQAAQLAANFMLSREAQQFLTKSGRLPTRTDVITNPPGVVANLQQKKVIVTISPADEKRKMQQLFNELFRPR